MPSKLEYASVDEPTRKAAVAELSGDAILMRWAVFAEFYGWRDEGCGLRVLPNDALKWMAGDRWARDFDQKGCRIREYIAERLPIEIADHIPNRRNRLIIKDGLSASLHNAIQRDRYRSKNGYTKRVNFLTGNVWQRNDATEHRKRIKAQADAILGEAASYLTETAYYVCKRLNERSSRLQSKVTKHVDEARRKLETMRIEVQVNRRVLNDADGEPLKGDDGKVLYESWPRARGRAKKQRKDLRNYYAQVLDAIEDQHQQFYAPSRRGRTDRVFALNDGVLMLPKKVRKILLQDFHEIDLSSAHLRIAASLWGAQSLLDALGDDAFSIWDELAGHLGMELTDDVKGVLKEALYSTVYGMKRSNIQATVNRALGKEHGYGQRFLAHPLIDELLTARDRELAEIERRGIAISPDGIVYELDENMEIDARSCLASVAQHVEQELMRVILEYEEDEKVQKRFKVAFWLHDGCYVNINRSTKKHLKNINDLLQGKASALGVRAKFDHTVPLVDREPASHAPTTADIDGSPCPDMTVITDDSTISSTQTSTKGTISRMPMRPQKRTRRRLPGASPAMTDDDWFGRTSGARFAA